MNIACIGDSLVNGYPFSRAYSWPALLASRTGNSCFNFGVNGETSSQICRRLLPALRSCRPELVFLSGGTNDFIFTAAEPDDVMARLTQMAADAKNAGVRPALSTPLLTIPEAAWRMWADDTDYEEVNRKLKQLREQILSFCHKDRLPCVDAQSAYETLVKQNRPADPLASALYVDGIHPTMEGYSVLADLFQPLTAG